MLQSLPSSGRWNRLLDSAMLIGLVTVVAYVAEYQFERGYLAYFGLDSQQARVQLEYMLAISLVLILGLVVIAYMVQMVVLWCALTKRHWLQVLLAEPFVAVGLALVWTAMSYPDHYRFEDNFLQPALRIWGVLASATVVGWGINLVARRIAKKLNRQKQWQAKLRDIAPHVRRLGALFLASIGIVTLMSSTYTIGHEVARSRVSHQIIKWDGKDLMLIRQYDNHMVTEQYDSQDKRLTGYYYYLNTQKIESLRYYTIYEPAVHIANDYGY